MSVTIRPRTADDVRPLAHVIVRQSPHTGYPVSFPTDDPADFVARPGELLAWAADDDGTPVGHISVLRATRKDDAQWNLAVDAWCDFHGQPIEKLGIISALFMDVPYIGTGLGRRLMEHATSELVAAGLYPCLDVIQQHEAAIRLYEKLGWQKLLEYVPVWLPATGKGPDIAMAWRCA